MKFAELGTADGKVKNMVFGGNAARLYGLDVGRKQAEIAPDRLSVMKQEHRRSGGLPSNRFYGEVFV